ncbi:hypothetical protein E8E14_013370 [Neopestalotiopsis sp. 37M]|nr:hypothetical protein E8E14_013370 [Neopestalotiopsis sp. 37M]
MRNVGTTVRRWRKVMGEGLWQRGKPQITARTKKAIVESHEALAGMPVSFGFNVNVNGNNHEPFNGHCAVIP